MATMMALAVMLCPLANVTDPEDTAVTGVLRCSDVVFRDAASCSEICPMPRAGTTESPFASVRKMTSNMRRDVERLGLS